MSIGRAERAGGPALSPADTLREAYAKLVRAFHDARLPSPDIDARFLLRGVLHLDPGEMLRAPTKPIGSGCDALAAAAARRLNSEPVARILGEREFYGRMFEISGDVLDPRSDTETLIDEALAIVDRNRWQGRPLRIADVGLGSGAILVTLLAELPLASGTGTDISPAALEVARRNAHAHGVGDRMTVVQADVLHGIGGPFDILVSNPPYIPSNDIADLAPDVRNFDPLEALDGGADGLSIYRRLYEQTAGLEWPSHIVLEVGAGQATDVAEIFSEGAGVNHSWNASFRDDLGGHTRCVTLERQSCRQSSKTVGSSPDTR